MRQSGVFDHVQSRGCDELFFTSTWMKGLKERLEAY